MELAHSVRLLSEKLLMIPFILIFAANILISLKTRFIQVRMLPTMLRLFWGNKKKIEEDENPNTLPSRKALFAVMSTSLGIANIVGPIIAIGLGGPGALFGFLMAVFFGAATIFCEVNFALHYRKRLPDGSYAGGPMQYLKKAIAPWAAMAYAISGALMLLAWSTAQSNTFADIGQTHGIPSAVTGIFMAIFVLLYLLAGIRKIGDLSSKIVPIMFVSITSFSLIIIFVNITKLPAVIVLILKSAFTPKALGGAGIGVMLRYALAKGTQASEAAVGTTTIPHSQAEIKSPREQSILAMLSAYAVLLVCTLVGLVVLLTGTWQDPTIGLGINTLARSYAQYIPAGISNFLLLIAVFLFSFGTIIGNCYNGSRCFSYVTKNRWLTGYYVTAAIILAIGSIFPVELVWSFLDFFIIPVALINIWGILSLLYRHKNLHDIQSQSR